MCYHRDRLLQQYEHVPLSFHEFSPHANSKTKAAGVPPIQKLWVNYNLLRLYISLYTLLCRKNLTSLIYAYEEYSQRADWFQAARPRRINSREGEERTVWSRFRFFPRCQDRHEHDLPSSEGAWSSGSMRWRDDDVSRVFLDGDK